MENRVLIFGLGFQGKKYVEYFLNRKIIVDGVTKSGLNKKNINGLKNIYKSGDIQKEKNIFFGRYSNIIISIYPITEQDKIINFFLKINFTGKIIIEKPVSYNLKLLEKLIYKENYYFFIDEIALSNYYNQIFKNNTKLIFETITEQSNIEHIFGAFLLFPRFKNYLNNVKIIDNNLNNDTNIFYNIKLNKIILNCDKGMFKLNNNFIYNMTFEKSLEYIYNLGINDNKLIKINFLLLQHNLSKNMKY